MNAISNIRNLFAVAALAIGGQAQALNPQPIPPGRGVIQALNPQPIPPGRGVIQALNPQPIPPGKSTLALRQAGSSYGPVYFGTGTRPQIDPAPVQRRTMR